MKFFWRFDSGWFKKLENVFKTLRRNKVIHKQNYINNNFYSDVEAQNILKFRNWRTPKSIITRWTPLVVGTYTVWLYNRNFEDNITNFEIECYSHLPLRIVSKIWGSIANTKLPISMRPYIYEKYSNTFGVNIEEAEVQDFKAYPSLGDFFVRRLKPAARIVDSKSCLVSPCDGRVLHCGSVTSDSIEQVKGITYTLENFFGENTWNVKTDSKDYYKSLLKNDEENILHQCVIYLAPGDYHRFHSPCDWKATFRRHFSGKLLSVNPVMAKLIPGLFCVNERAVYVGEWKYGFFSFTPVGATNVGSIEVYKDAELKTNRRKLKWNEDLALDQFNQSRGEMVGQFNMGSTIVLIFEAPKNFQFAFQDGDRVKMGEKLGYIEERKKINYV
ncbi:phosphatidylserine decarboxylase proenzyme, mitochondrial-like [Arctopsyche grandis]|uniref:phosphatidylserine decarboxylase proenzyme, mitochondrial-like n=1 Tax=Arctopsyche grandis TaxID=121162 RepID=UPI00406D78E7